VNVDGEWYDDANPVATNILPFDNGSERMLELRRQCRYAAEHYGNPTRGIALNFMFPHYEPFEDGWRAVTDREAIYYGHLATRVIGPEVYPYSWDYFGTYSTLTRNAAAPDNTGLPQQPHFKYSRDPIYFLDLGDYADEEFEDVALGGGRRAILRFFEKGFIIVNASDPAQDINVDLSGHPLLETKDKGASGTYDHFARSYLPEGEAQFQVPAAYYPLVDRRSPSGRVYSYVDNNGQLIQK
jgi:hypothetical protein